MSSGINHRVGVKASLEEIYKHLAPVLPHVILLPDGRVGASHC
jgi:hypothetical protein